MRISSPELLIRSDQRSHHENRNESLEMIALYRNWEKCEEAPAVLIEKVILLEIKKDVEVD